jgi:hypothetical protein
MSGLREAFDEIVADVPVYGDLDRAIEQAERERRRRYGVAAGLAAAAAAVVLVVGVLAVTRDENGSPDPSHQSPAPTEKPTPTDSASDATSQALNGRIQSKDDYLRRLGITPCEADSQHGCATSKFRSDTGTLLLIDQSGGWDSQIEGIRVVDRGGLVADLRCPADFACASYAIYGLGPGSEEFYELTYPGRLRVWGFDGTRRPDPKLPTEFLYASNADFAWSPDGSRLAVAIGSPIDPPAAGNHGDLSGGVWLIESNGEAKLVYRPLDDERPIGARPIDDFDGLSWSPDGSRLGFFETHWGRAALGPKAAASVKAVSLLLPDPEDGGRGEPTTLYDSPDAQVFLWSPDGARVAIRDLDRVLELSAEDGTVLVEHPFIEGDLIWPQGER